ncbi:MAG: ABC transporter substrate-binding protein [Intestinimonas sp.]|jgi:branched-chain amino acid transport system substrate-binding protein|nr:ABC transporter substrate-binding protein [Intestinimonas sp.]
MKNRVIQKVAALFLASGMVMSLAACNSSADSSAAPSSSEAAASAGGTSKGTIKFGLIAPLTGVHAEYGQGFQTATKIAADEINAAGGVNGYQIEIEVQDSAADPKTSADIATQFCEDDDIKAIIGDFTSSCCMADAPIVDQYQCVLLSPTASNPDYAPMSDYCFSVMYNQANMAPWVGKSVIGKYMGVKSVAVMYLNTDWGISTNQYLLQGLSEAGIQVLADEAYEEKETDFSSIIAKLKASNAEAVCILDQGNVPTIINQIKTSGWGPKLVTQGPGASQQMLDLCGKNAEGLVITDSSYITEDNPKTKDFYDKFYAMNQCAPTDHSLCAYNCVEMLASAIESIGDGDITREAIKDALKTTTYDGMAGTVKFDENGGGVRQFLILGVKDGKYVVDEDYGYE